MTRWPPRFGGGRGGALIEADGRSILISGLHGRGREILIAVVVNSKGGRPPATPSSTANTSSRPQVTGLWLNIRILLISVLGVAVFATLLAAALWPVPCSLIRFLAATCWTFSEASPSWSSST